MVLQGYLALFKTRGLSYAVPVKGRGLLADMQNIGIRLSPKLKLSAAAIPLRCLDFRMRGNNKFFQCIFP